VELEVLSFDSWIGFWRQLGVERAGLEVAWSNFVYRYLAGSCSLPEALHAAAGRCTLAELHRVAGSCGVAVCRVRGYSELIIDQGWTERPTRSGVRCEPDLGRPWTLQAGSGKHERNGIHHSPSDPPLAGLRVVEITSRLQGPLAGLLLRLLGADVLKVEPPGGDFGRHSPPLAGSRGAAYLAYNRDKRVVEIDYKQPEGRAQLVDLIAGADVVLHNWPLRRAEKLGLDFEDLERVNPGLVYAHASGWGRVGNEPSPIAGDSLVQAHAACGDGLNPADEPAFPSRVTILDALGGLLACEGILAGLYLRDCTGHGSRVDTSLFAGAMALQAHILRSMPPNSESGRRLGRPLWGPLDRPLETGDGFLTLDLSDPRARPCVARLCGCHPDAPDELIAQRLLRRTAAEWETLICASGVPAAAVQTDLASLPADPRVGGLLERVEDACWAPAAPWRLSL
jgi:crotonobetainyl-CoA:carnitine CoA-transferase CaiB-like acyl-CoA transferase